MGQPPSDQPLYPLILLDDDQWLYVCETHRELWLAVEPDFLDDIEAAFDALGRPLELSAPDDEVVVRVSGPPRPDALRQGVEQYFGLWTYSAPPEFHDAVPQYIASVIASVKTAGSRRKKGRPDS
ncbi:hypothetical protein [Streptomyces melanogenes]|uniref:hypothetical protein n=1 Tax=Streptomyces melanogenes TaxID=67326 RepID=UPI0037A82731